MRKFFFIVFTILSFEGVTQNTLTGKVVDAENESPLAGVTIYISDLKKGAITNEAGNFMFEGLPKGKFLIESKLIGYTSLVQTVLVDGSQELTIKLSSEVTELHEVVVTGISHSTELRRNPIPLTTINNQFMVENASTNLIDNISKKPGISQISTGAAISKPVIRGLSYNRIITLNDGIRQEGQQWGDEHGIEIDEFSVDRVEIIKGAGSLMYGSDGLGGVVNFLAPNPVASGSIVGKWMSNYQTNNGLVANSISTAGNVNGVYWLTRISNKFAKAYTNMYDGKVLNSGFREINLNGTIGFNKKWGFTEFDASIFNQSVGLVEGDRDSNGNFVRLINDNGNEAEVIASDADLNTYSLFIPKQNIQHVSASNTSNLYFGESRIQLNVGYQRNQRKEFGNVLDESEAELYFDLHTLNYNLIYFFKSETEWQFSAGTSGMAQENKNRGEEFLIPEYRSFDWGVFSFVKRPFGKFDVAGGLRFDHRTINSNALYLDADGKPTNSTGVRKFREADLAFENISASVGATYEFSKQLIGKLNVSRGFRAPTISELQSNGRHEGTLRYEYGNVNLNPEISLQVDASMLVNSQHVSAEFSLFQNSIDDYIYTEKLLSSNGMDSIPDPSDPAPAYQYVQGSAQLYGSEITLDIHPHPLDWLHFENSFSFVIGDNKSQEKNDSAKYLPFIPAPRLQSELRANIKKLGNNFFNAFVKVELNYLWEQHRVLLDNGTETPTSSYALWNIGMGTAMKNKKRNELFSFYFTITNLFDKAYQHHLSRLKYAAENQASGRVGVFNMGRNFSIKIVVPVVFKKSAAM
jgi:iron complex outermembrane receptor protein